MRPKRGKRDSLRAIISGRLRADKTSAVAKAPAPTELDQATLAAESGPLVYWPRDLLPDDCPRSRVLVYGYDSKVTKYIKAASNKNTVFSHGKDLLFTLSRARQLDRPLIFIAHSLGGVVVKEMLAQSSIATDDALHNIVDSTSAVIFLGTPHRGSQELAAVGEWARSLVSTALRMESNDAILNALNLKTTDLERAQEAFSALWFKYDFRVKTFQEGLGLTGVNLSVLGNKVVPDYSSLLGDPRERAETIQANHMDMCRFTGPEDPNYSKLSGEISAIYASLVALNEQKVHSDGHILRRKPAPSIRSARSVRSARSGRSRSDRPRGFDASEMESLNKLWYPGMDKRRQTVDEPAAQTCLWLFEQETYQHWIQYHNQDESFGLLWLKGKPGAGKSTLMKEALRRVEVCQGPTEFWTASFFFNAKGSELEHSSVGLLRSVLHQLLPRYPSHLRRFTQLMSFKALLSDKPPEPNESELKTFLQSIFATKIEPKVVIFIDALDECDTKSMRPQAYFWREVTKTAHAAGNQLSVCISSRHFPSISITDCPEIIVDRHNNQDIITYVNQRFSLSIPDINADGKALRGRILGKSAGVFLWVTLVVEDVLKKWDEGESLRCLLRGLDSIPMELEALFSSLLQEVEPNLRPLTLQLFRWAVLATRPLRLYEWHHVLGFVNDFPLAPPSLSAWRESSHFVENSEQLARRIRTLSKGLIEMTSVVVDRASGSSGSSSIQPGAGSLEIDQGENRIVQVIHESVRGFFLSGGASTLFDNNSESSFVAQGHLSIMETCLCYINIKEMDALVEARLAPTHPSPAPNAASALHVDPRRNSHVTSESSVSLWSSPSSELRPSQPALTVPGVAQRNSPRSSSGSRPNRLSHLAAGSRSHRTSDSSVKSFGSAYSHDSSAKSKRRRHSYDPGLDPVTMMRGMIAKGVAGGWSPMEARPPTKKPEESVFDKLKKSADAAWDRDYFAQRMSMYRIAPDQISINLPLPQLSVAGKTQTLEAYAALLQYAVFEMFTHAELAQEAGADPSPIIRRLQADGHKLWARWVALAEDLPLDTGLLYYAADQGLTSWLGKLGSPEWTMRPEELRVREFIRKQDLAHFCDWTTIASGVIEAVNRRNNNALDLLLQHFGYHDSYIDKKDRPVLHLLAAKHDATLLRTFLIRIRESAGSPLKAGAGGTPPFTLLDRLDRNGRAALHIAVARGDTRIASELLQHGANIDATDIEGRTALHLACTNRSEQEPIPSGHAGSPKMTAAPPHEDMVKLLLSRGAHVNSRDRDGHTPLHAICYNIPEPDILTEDLPDPVDGLGGGPGGGVVDIIDLLLDHGADVNAQSDILTAPLHIACRAGVLWRESCPNTFAAVKRLLDAGAYPSVHSNSSETPLHIAAARADRNIVSELLCRRVAPDMRDSLRQTPLHHAAWAANDDAAEEILKHDAQNSLVHNIDHQGSTPLHFACQFYPAQADEELRARSIRLITRLLERGAQVHSAKNWLGLSPYQIAASSNSLEVSVLLKEFGGEPPAWAPAASTPIEADAIPEPAEVPSLFRRFMRTLAEPIMGRDVPGAENPGTTTQAPEPENRDYPLATAKPEQAGSQLLNVKLPEISSEALRPPLSSTGESRP